MPNRIHQCYIPSVIVLDDTKYLLGQLLVKHLVLTVQLTRWFRVQVHSSSDCALVMMILTVNSRSIKHNVLAEGDRTVEMITALVHSRAESSDDITYDDSSRTCASVIAMIRG